MARVSREAIKAEKEFYPRNYRRVVKFLFVSLILNFCLFALVAYVKLNRPMSSYYATSSNGEIAFLMRVSGPNTTATALLKPSPKSDSDQKKLEDL